MGEGKKAKLVTPLPISLPGESYSLTVAGITARERRIEASNLDVGSIFFHIPIRPAAGLSARLV